MYCFKYNQQDPTLYNILYCCQCSTCFRRFPRPSSGAHKLYTQHLVYVKLAVNATVSVGELAFTHASGSIDSNKEYCITLHLVGYTKMNTLTMHGTLKVKKIYIYNRIM
jgi:hypothetical protein